MKKKPDSRAEMCQEYHDALMPALRHLAERCGYALAIHGSLKRDIDIIAAPWRESPICAESLVEHIRKACEEIIGIATISQFNEGKPEKKPNGRLAFAIHLTPDKERGCYLDISVMPIVERTQCPQTTLPC